MLCNNLLTPKLLVAKYIHNDHSMKSAIALVLFCFLALFGCENPVVAPIMKSQNLWETKAWQDREYSIDSSVKVWMLDSLPKYMNTKSWDSILSEPTHCDFGNPDNEEE